jgi:anti-sigma B factor antagonist
MMFIKAKRSGDTAILECVGRLVAGEEIATLKRSALCTAPSDVLVLDLSRVDKVDGAGLGLLAFLQGWSRSAGVRLKIADPSPRMLKLLELTKLTSVLEICTRYEVEQNLEDAPGPGVGCPEAAAMMMAAQR